MSLALQMIFYCGATGEAPLISKDAKDVLAQVSGKNTLDLHLQAQCRKSIAEIS